MNEIAPPITHEYVLRCSVGHAFATYASRIDDWWDPRYTANAGTLEELTIEPRVGGRVYATHRDVGEDDWGEVIVWDPPHRLVHTFTLAQDPAHPSEVAVELPRRGPAGACSASPTAAGLRRTPMSGGSSGTGR
jgi:uncharacterized protein YndB with AHSA1/START domain